MSKDVDENNGTTVKKPALIEHKSVEVIPMARLNKLFKRLFGYESSDSENEDGTEDEGYEADTESENEHRGKKQDQHNDFHYSPLKPSSRNRGKPSKAPHGRKQKQSPNKSDSDSNLEDEELRPLLVNGNPN